MKEFWNKRYAEKEYVYGVEPNEFFKKQLPNIPIGKILFPAEGEGRNAVHAAVEGYEVYAFDSSEEGQKKALRLAKEKNVTLNYQLASVENIDYPKQYFDGIVFVFAHFPKQVRNEYYQKLLSFLKPNGCIIFEAFGKEQLKFNSGGPKEIEMLFSESEVTSIFKNREFLSLDTMETLLNEGEYHQGRASVIRFLARNMQ